MVELAAVGFEVAKEDGLGNRVESGRVAAVEVHWEEGREREAEFDLERCVEDPVR